ncbi:copper resistance CopC family protein [Dictyobacter alpinus]|uniref:copper resistance CopC family protein n=1 Tax=Dictyobacter alpinus TaxID=2014873 RepID=UPI001386D176|nr:copper resistance protein CopC [Dictyobacter alpinus]
MATLAYPVSVQYAEYVSSTPAANASLNSAPATVQVRFSALIDIQRSNLIVEDVDGKQVSTGRLNPAHIEPETLVVRMQADQSEIYVVNWHTTSSQGGYRDSGSFRFFVHVSPLLQSTLSKMSSLTPAVTPSSTSIQARKPGTVPVSSLRLQIPLWIAGVISLISLISGIGLTWIFSQQAKERRAIALIEPMADEDDE